MWLGIVWNRREGVRGSPKGVWNPREGMRSGLGCVLQADLDGLGGLRGRLEWPWRRLGGDLARRGGSRRSLERVLGGLGGMMAEVLDVLEASGTPC